MDREYPFLDFDFAQVYKPITTVMQGHFPGCTGELAHGLPISPCLSAADRHDDTQTLAIMPNHSG